VPAIIHYSLFIIHYSLFIIHCSLFIIHCSLFIVHYSLFIIHCSLFIVHYSLFIIHYSLFIVHYSLLSVHYSNIQTSAILADERVLTYSDRNMNKEMFMADNDDSPDGFHWTPAKRSQGVNVILMPILSTDCAD
jgi:hypothetical protein